MAVSKINKPIRILVLCPKGDFNSGGIISNFELLKYLKDKGCHVKVITAWQGTYNKTLTRAGFPNKTINYNWWTSGDDPKDISQRAMSAVFKICDEIREFRADIVMTNTSHIPWGAFAASFTNTPHIWIVREFPINNFEYLAARVPFIRQYSNKMMANSEGLARFYKEVYGHNVGSFMSYVDVDEMHLMTNDKNHVTTFVSPNYISKTKNQVDLIKAAAILRKRRKDLHFNILLMGEKDRAYWPIMEKTINESIVADIATVRDRTDQPWRLVANDDIMVQTSLSESIGRTTTEAMKLGVPVIASDIPGHREAFKHGGGVLYEIGDANMLAVEMERMLDDPKRTKRLASSAQKLATKNMSREACNRPVLEAINEVVSQPHPVGGNQQIAPYLQQYTKEYNALNKELSKKHKDTDILLAAIEEIKNSRTYRLGAAQTRLLRKVRDVVRSKARSDDTSAH